MTSQGTPDGGFYGTTICGGTLDVCNNTFGVVYRVSGVGAVTQDGSAFSVLHAFNGADEGGYPNGALVQATDGNFYGTTNCGGTIACFGGDGTIYRISPTGAFTTIHPLNGPTEGSGPYGALIQGRDGNLYGQTYCGGGGIDCLSAPAGSDGGGTIFKLDLQGNGFTVLKTFASGDAAGCRAQGALLEDRTTAGIFYGTMNDCGTGGAGTIFKLDTTLPSNNPRYFQVIHTFTGSADGAHPTSGLTAGADGTTLYGTTEFGGLYPDYGGIGTLYKINTDGSGFTVLYTFHGQGDGGNPYAGVIQAYDGTLYGTAFYPSVLSPTGTLFRLDPSTLQFDTVYTFSGGVDGQNPSGKLTQIDESYASGFTGSLIGTTMLGPQLFDSAGNVISGGSGTVFRFVPPPVLLCPANPAPVNATDVNGASVSLSATLIDPANTATTITWQIDGSTVQTDNVPPALTLATSTRTTKSMTSTYSAGLAGSAASQHTVFIHSVDQLGLSSSCQATVEVDKLNQTITFPAIGVQTYAPGKTVTLSATSFNGTTATGLPVSFALVSGPGSVAGSVLTITGAGSIVVQALQGGDGQYNPATSVSQTVTVNKAAQTITFAPIANQTFANPAPVLTLTPTSDSGLPVTLAVTGPATLAQTGPSTYSLTLTGVGTVTVTASQPGDANYNAATNVARSFSVSKGSQTITFPAIPAQTFGNPPITLQATATSGLPVTYSVTGPGTITAGVLTITGAGTIGITASQSGNGNFNAAANVSQNVSVATASQTISFPVVPPQVFGNPPVTLSATSTSGLPVTYTVSGPGTLNGSQLTITGAGTIVVTANQSGNGNYAAAPPVSQSIAVAQAAQTISFPAVPPQTLGNAPVTLAATASSGLPVSYAIVSGPGTISGNVLTINGAGTIVVSATQAGGTNYLAAAPVTQSISVAKASQTITFPAVPTQFLGYPPVVLNATASSGLPITYTASGPGTINGNVLTVTGVGTIVVTASQGGDANYNAAAPVQQNVTVLDTSQSPLARFVVFSTDLSWLHTGTTVTSGDVGANMSRRHDAGDDDDDDEHDDWDKGKPHGGRSHWNSGDSVEAVGNTVTVRLDTAVRMQQASSRVVGDTVMLGPLATIYGLVDNTLINRLGIVLGTRVDSMPLPFLTMPSFPSIAAGLQNITVKKNSATTLAAGAYGAVSVQSGATLTLTGGLYQIASLDVDKNATVQFEAPVELRIQKSLDADTGSKLIPDPAIPALRASQVVIYVGGSNSGCSNSTSDSLDTGFGGPSVVNIGERATVRANIYAPAGSIWLKSRSTATGAFIGQHVVIGSFSTLTLDSAFF